MLVYDYFLWPPNVPASRGGHEIAHQSVQTHTQSQAIYLHRVFCQCVGRLSRSKTHDLPRIVFRHEFMLVRLGPLFSSLSAFPFMTRQPSGAQSVVCVFNHRLSLVLRHKHPMGDIREEKCHKTRMCGEKVARVSTMPSKVRP